MPIMKNSVLPKKRKNCPSVTMSKKFRSPTHSIERSLNWLCCLRSQLVNAIRSENTTGKITKASTPSRFGSRKQKAARPSVGRQLRGRWPPSGAAGSGERRGDRGLAGARERADGGGGAGDRTGVAGAHGVSRRRPCAA